MVHYVPEVAESGLSSGFSVGMWFAHAGWFDIRGGVGVSQRYELELLCGFHVHRFVGC